VATTLNSVSHVLRDEGRYDEAAAALQDALEIARPALGRDHQLVGIYTVNLAAVLLAQRQAKAAEGLLREGLRVRALSPEVVPNRRRTTPDDDWSVGAIRSLHGASLLALGRYEDAERELLAARSELHVASDGSLRRDIETNTTRLIALYQAWGKPDRAAAYRALQTP
jgi:tetratricopeptide (TPR) repeat protein